MSQMIETMESRTLLTASVATLEQDFITLKGADTVAKDDLKTTLASLATDVKLVKSVVNSTHPIAAQKTLLKTFEKDEVSAVAQYKKTITSILATGLKDGTKLASLLKSSFAHPLNSKLQGKVQAELTALENVFSNSVVTTVETNAGTTVGGLETDMNNLAASVTAAQGDVMTTETLLSNALGTLGMQASGIQADVTQLATDIG